MSFLIKIIWLVLNGYRWRCAEGLTFKQDLNQPQETFGQRARQQQNGGG
ncbi:hypothetical protein NA640_16840 [Pseudomonas xanthomarina]|nr:hypothetical protein [Stutzerimonas xanthomarina]MCP9340240.1 hypothetical protein [Stutzerimonas xanthomarina]